MRITRSSPLLAVLLALSGPAFSQDAENEVELEGPITSMECAEDVSNNLCQNVIITVLGTQAYVSKTTPIITPTADLTGRLNLLLARRSMHIEGGVPGFTRSSTIITGAHVDGKVIADNVWVDISENVVLGTVTKNEQADNADPDEFVVEGTRIVLVPSKSGGDSMPKGYATFDNRMPGMPLMNDYGIPIRGDSIDEGTLVSAEGYYYGSVFYAWLLEVSGGIPVEENVSQVSILRAQCRVRDVNEIELEVMGGSYTPAGATIRVFAPAGRATNTDGTPTTRVTRYGDVPAEADADNPEFGLFDLDIRQAPPAGTSGCPTGIRVEMLNPPSAPTGGNGRVLSPGIFSVDVR